MPPVRVGAVGYLNARPLTWALDRRPDRWQIRYDLPSVCAGLLQRGEVDLGLIPSIEYLRSPDYGLVPGVAIGSDGPIASVALYTRVPVAEIRSIALDTSSRTSAALLQILCHRHFAIAPTLASLGPDLTAMVQAHDAALLIGDPAFEVDHRTLGLEKIDLGEQWTRMTGLPFVYAAWTGRRAAIDAAQVRALQEAGAEGTRSLATIAAEYAPGRPAAAARAETYLRDNVKYGFGVREAAGLQRFLDYAAELGLAERSRPLTFF